jgi:hypothetical protein
MRTFATLAACLLVLAPATAQPKETDLSALPEVIKNLEWKSIDPATFTPLERCRVLQFLDDAIDDIGSSSRAEADLLSAYIDEQALGPAFTESPAPESPVAHTYDDGVKIAAAMLRGPLASSSYATEYEGTDANFLKATTRLLESSSQRKWSEVVENRLQVQWMTRFLRDQNLFDAFMAWVPGEVERRDQEYQAELAQKRADAAAKRDAQQQKAAETREAKEAQARQEEAAREVERQNNAAAQQMQQAMTAAQQPVIISPDDDDDYYYGYGTAAYLGTSNWYRDSAYRGSAGARVNNRMSGWRRSGGGGGGRGGRGGGRR